MTGDCEIIRQKSILPPFELVISSVLSQQGKSRLTHFVIYIYLVNKDLYRKKTEGKKTGGVVQFPKIWEMVGGSLASKYYSEK